jgi:PAS domain S-box-containing protein
MDDDNPREAPVTDLPEWNFRAARNSAIVAGLRPTALGLSVFYALFAIAHTFLLSPPISQTMAEVASVTAIMLLAVWLRLRLKPLASSWAHPAGALMAILVLANCALGFYFVGQPRQTTNFMLLVVGVGCFFLSYAWLSLMIGLILATWCALVWQIRPAEAWTHFALALLASTMLAVLVHWVRMRVFRRVEQLAAQGRTREEELVRALSSAENSRHSLEAAKRELEVAMQLAQQSEARFRRLSEATFEGILFHDNNRILDVNQSLAGMFGYDVGELVSMNPVGLFPQQARQRVGAYLLSPADDAFRCEGRRKDGTDFPIEMRSRAIFHRGRTVQVVAVHDITEKIRTEEALRESEEKYRELFENANDIVYSHDLIGTITTINRAVERVSGYTRNEILHKSVFDLMTAEGSKEARHYVDLRLAGAAPPTHEVEWIAKDGRRITLEASSRLLCRGDQKVGVEEIARDISDRKRVEHALEQLRHEQELILNSVLEGIVRVDAAGNVTFANPAAGKLTGYSVEELVGINLHNLLHYQRPDGSEYPWEECPTLQALKDGTPQAVHGEVFTRKDKSVFPVDYSCNPVLAGGSIRGSVITFSDISERKAVDRMKDEFVSMVSHELRTPLTSIRGALGLMAGGLLQSDPPKAMRMLQIAISNSDRLVRLINDVLDIERMESGKITLLKQDCSLSNLMTQAAETMRAMAEKAEVILRVTPVEARIWADPDRIQQTLTNLLSNAIKFSPPEATVWLSGELKGADVTLQVRDQGRGIPEDKLHSVFERFQQVDASDSRKKGGTGLGLAICRSIVNQHGGEIWVESELGVGSTFFVRLPTGKGPAELLVPQGAEDQAAKKVLFVEDDLDLVRVASTIFDKHGIRTLHARGVAEAKALLQGEPPALLIIDLGLQEGDGKSLLEWIRTKPEFKEIRLLVFTADDLDGAEKAGLKLPTSCCLVKGRTTMEELVDRGLQELSGAAD